MPIIHSDSDLGSLGSAIDRRSASLYGEERWAEHKDTIARFWERVADCLLLLDVANLKIYQDGVVVGGELGRRIVEEAAKRGSMNHQIILCLMNRGAELRKTEDTPLLLEELRLADEEFAAGSVSEDTRRNLDKARLTDERDRFIAKTIDGTLMPGETGILFIGAYHNVHHYLPGDITVEQLKEQTLVKDYFRELVSGESIGRFQELAHYLTSPIAVNRRSG